MHLTDEQLNEYLDNESTERVQIESHLHKCADCAARLTALQSLFAEIESLPEMSLSQDIASRFNPTPNLIPKLPGWLTLTATLQAVLAIVAMIVAAPIVTTLLPVIETPTLIDVWISVQSQWITWLDALSQIKIPQFPELSLSLESSSALMTSALVGLFMFWIVGNGLLLRKQMK